MAAQHRNRAKRSGVADESVTTAQWLKRDLARLAASANVQMKQLL